MLVKEKTEYIFQSYKNMIDDNIDLECSVLLAMPPRLDSTHTHLKAFLTFGMPNTGNSLRFTKSILENIHSNMSF